MLLPALHVYYFTGLIKYLCMSVYLSVCCIFLQVSYVAVGYVHHLVFVEMKSNRKSTRTTAPYIFAESIDCTADVTFVVDAAAIHADKIKMFIVDLLSWPQVVDSDTRAAIVKFSEAGEDAEVWTFYSKP